MGSLRDKRNTTLNEEELENPGPPRRLVSWDREDPSRGRLSH